jgi:hypothetical protein
MFDFCYNNLGGTQNYGLDFGTTVHSRYVEVGGNKKKYRDNESSRYPIWRF